MSATDEFLQEAGRMMRPTVCELMAEVARDIGAVAKALKNEQAGYSARSIDDVLNAVHGPLSEHGVVLAPKVLNATYEVVHVGRNQTPMRQATLKVRFRFYGPTGDHVDVVTCGEALDSGDKATNKAMSAALKYALLHTFTIPLVGDDADRTSYERAAPPAPSVDRALIETVQARVVDLPDDLKSTFAEWKNDQGFPWPWPAAACDAMLVKLDKLACSSGGEPEPEQAGDARRTSSRRRAASPPGDKSAPAAPSPAPAGADEGGGESASDGTGPDSPALDLERPF